MGVLSENRTAGIARWAPPICWGALVVLLSLLPDVFFFGTPKNDEARHLHYYIEVMVHVFQSCVFFLLILRPLRSTQRSRAAVVAAAFAALLLLSLVNESVQAFTPTRMFDFVDMTMDALGGIVGLGLALAADAV